MMKLSKNKKAQALTFNALPQVFIIIGVAAIIGAIMLSVLSGLKDDFGKESCPTGFPFYNSTSDLCQNGTSGVVSTEFPTQLSVNATANANTGIANITAKYPLLGTVIGSVVILSAVVAGFAFFARRREEG